MAIDALTLLLLMTVLLALAGILTLYAISLCVIATWMRVRDWYLNQINFEDANV